MVKFIHQSKSSSASKQILSTFLIVWLANTVSSTIYFAIEPSYCNHCRTLNELIENGTSIFRSNTTLVLLPGLHIINSTKNIFLISNIGSLELTGREGEATVRCVHEFGFKFVDIKDITLGNIRFESCSVLTEFDGRDVVIQRSTKVKSTITILNVQNVDIYTLDIDGGGVAVLPKNVINTKFRFQEMTIANGQLGIYITKQGVPNGNLKIYVHDSEFQDAFMDVIATKVCPDIDRLEIRDVSYYDRTKSSYPALYVINVCEVHLTNVKFENNSSPLLEMITIDKTVFKGFCSISYNNGKSGLLLRTKTFLLYPNTKFEMTFNSVQRRLLSIQFQGKSTSAVWFNTKVYIQNNTIRSGAVMEVVSGNSIKVVGSSFIFKNNSGLTTISTAVLLINDALEFSVSESSFLFSHNKATLSGGITLVKTRMIVYSYIRAEFKNNEGGDGAAMAFYKKSTIIFLPKDSSNHVNVYFLNNKAMKRGGAIFVEDLDYMDIFTKKLDPYFIKLPIEEISSSLQFQFSNNSAQIAGNDVYGGWIDLCKFSLIMWNITENDYNAVTSNPLRICLCLNSVPTCSITTHKKELFPGQIIEIEAVAVGQRMGTVPSIVLAQFSEKEGNLEEGQSVQSVGRECSRLQFTIYTSKQSKELVLKAQDIGVPKFTRSQRHSVNNKYLSQQFSILIEVKDCKAGFEFHTTSKKCICSPFILQHDGVSCNLNTFMIQRTEGKWLSITEEHSNGTLNTGIIIHDNCPHDYCRRDSDSLTFLLDTPDDQCAFNRSGVLCGACKANLSQVLGTSRCRECSSLMVLVIVSAIVIAGILLVALLMLLNLTVSAGTINGVIFYANIIRASQAVFFPPEISNSFLSVFIAWLNLDLGIETCFYDGLDAYTKTWLQFIFPFYIWLMVITIIVASHYSSTASRLFGNNAVQVLATLFLLSYTKILRVIITVFSYTILIYPDGYEKKVWLLDGNVEFLCGKHIPLFIASLLMFILLSVSYTLSLISIQWLQRISHYHILFWVHKLMPLFDSYTGPYKHNHRYWTGLLLLTRILFILVFSLNISNNPAVNLLAIVVISFTILGYLCFMRVYKKLIHNILEAVSIFNLGQLSVATLYQISNGGSRKIVTNISTSIAFIIFVCIIFYHGIQRLLSLKKMKHIRAIPQLKVFSSKGDKENESLKNRQVNLSIINSEVTHTSIKLPLLTQET